MAEPRFPRGRMTAHEARGWALEFAANVLEREDWSWLNERFESAADGKRVRAALRQVASELRRKSRDGHLSGV